MPSRPIRERWNRVLSSESLNSIGPRRERAVVQGGHGICVIREKVACEGWRSPEKSPWDGPAHKSFQRYRLISYMKPVLPRSSACFVLTPRTNFAPQYINTATRSFFSFRKATVSSPANMSSATSFHEFKPLDSTFDANVAMVVCAIRKLTVMRREGQCLWSDQAQGQGRPCRKHRQQVWLHPSVRRPWEAVQRYVTCLASFLLSGNPHSLFL